MLYFLFLLTVLPYSLQNVEMRVLSLKNEWHFHGTGIQEVEGGFIVLGDQVSPYVSSVVKMDYHGSLTWALNYWYVEVADLVEMPDGGFLFVGRGSISTRVGFIIFRTTAEGQLQWAKNGTDVFGVGLSSFTTSDDGYIVNGILYEERNRGYIAKFDYNDTLLWSYSLKEPENIDEENCKMIETSASKILRACKSYLDMDRQGVFVQSFTSKGELEWSQLLKGGGEDGIEIEDIIQTRDGGILILGDYWDDDKYAYDMHLTKLKENGEVVWSRVFGKIKNQNCNVGDFGSAIRETLEGDFIVIGYSDCFAVYFLPILMKVSKDGSLVWVQIFSKFSPPAGYGRGTSLEILADGSILFTLFSDNFFVGADGDGSAAGYDDTVYGVLGPNGESCGHVWEPVSYDTHAVNITVHPLATEVSSSSLVFEDYEGVEVQKMEIDEALLCLIP